MGSNCFKANAHCILLFICFLQLAFTVTRQVFDFFGHIWASILFNFLAILVTICGCFGGCEKRNVFLYIYCIWQILAFFWNVFVVCFYLEIGSLFSRDKDLHILNFGTGSRSWFESNGPLCQPIFNVTNFERKYLAFIKPAHVEGCLLYYFIIETFQAVIQIILAIIAFIVSYALIYYNNHKSTKTESRRCLSSSASLPAYSNSMRQSMRRSFHEPEIESLPSFYDLNQYTLKSSRSSIKSKTSRRPSSPVYINSQVL